MRKAYEGGMRRMQQKHGIFNGLWEHTGTGGREA